MQGYLHIFNIQTIHREGSKKDVELLKETFEGMGAKVECTLDSDKNALKHKMEEIKLKDFSGHSYVAIAYMSHGSNDGAVEVQDKALIQLQKTILMPLCNMESLNGKLKWLIMQTCRGKYDFMEQSTEGPKQTIPYPKYCVKFFATSEGMYAYRTASGSIFIKKLCARLKDEYKNHDIISIFNHTKDDVSSLRLLVNTNAIKQIPDSQSNLGTKKFYITSEFE